MTPASTSDPVLVYCKWLLVGGCCKSWVGACIYSRSSDLDESMYGKIRVVIPVSNVGRPPWRGGGLGGGNTIRSRYGPDIDFKKKGVLWGWNGGSRGNDGE